MAEPFAPTPAPAQWLSTSPPDEGGYILLVEDNPGDARLIRELLIDGAHGRLEHGALEFVQPAELVTTGLLRHLR